MCSYMYVQSLRLFSRARPTLNLPCISPQNSVTCNGEYRRPVIKAQPSFHGVLTNGVIFSTLKHTDPHTVRSRSTQKDGVCNEHIFMSTKLTFAMFFLKLSVLSAAIFLFVSLVLSLLCRRSTGVFHQLLLFFSVFVIRR